MTKTKTDNPAWTNARRKRRKEEKKKWKKQEFATNVSKKRN